MQKETEDLIKKIESMKDGSADLSRDEDLSIAIMNLVSLEEHFFFTAMKTGNGKYLDFMRSCREMRKQFMEKIVKNPVGGQSKKNRGLCPLR